MKILAFVDLHGNKSALKKIVSDGKNVDVIVCAGDLTIFGQEEDKILRELNNIGKPVLMIHGNHEDESELRRDCSRLRNLYFIHNRKFKFDGYIFVGWGGGGFSFKDRELERNMSKFKKWCENYEVILVTHAPPYNTKIDKIWNEHAGSKTVRKAIERLKPVLNICGHLHETVGEDKIKNCKVVNPGYKGKIIEV